MNVYPMTKVWTEDDAIGQTHPGYESVWDAFRRLSGSVLAAGDAEDIYDGGDEIRYLMPNGWVIVHSGAAASRIYKP